MLKYLKSFFVPKLYVAGLPLSDDSISQEFIDFFSEDVETICIMSGAFNTGDLSQSLEYKSASSGFNILIKNGYKFIDSVNFKNEKKAVVMYKDAWNRPDGTRRSANDVGKFVVDKSKELRKQHPNARILRIAPGSPYLYDGVSGYMIEKYPNLTVIDTKSSAELAYDRLCKILNLDLPAVIVDPTTGILSDKSINLIGCVGYVYKDYVKLENIINNIKPSSRIFDIKVGYVNDIKEVKQQDLKKLYQYTPGYSPSIIAIVDEN